MTPSQQCKQAGLPGVAYLARKYNVPYRTIYRWADARPEVFRGLILAASIELERVK